MIRKSSSLIWRRSQPGHKIRSVRFPEKVGLLLSSRLVAFADKWRRSWKSTDRSESGRARVITGFPFLAFAPHGRPPPDGWPMRMRQPWWLVDGIDVNQDRTTFRFDLPLRHSQRHTEVAEDTVEKWSRVFMLCMFAVPCLGQTQPAICPKHIESPTYPQLARATRIMGEVRLSVTVDAEGKCNTWWRWPEMERDRFLNYCETPQSRTCSTGRSANRRRHRTLK
jgi:hypothetical protein